MSQISNSSDMIHLSQSEYKTFREHYKKIEQENQELQNQLKEVLLLLLLFYI